MEEVKQSAQYRYYMRNKDKINKARSKATSKADDKATSKADDKATVAEPVETLEVSIIMVHNQLMDARKTHLSFMTWVSFQRDVHDELIAYFHQIRDN